MLVVNRAMEAPAKPERVPAKVHSNSHSKKQAVPVAVTSREVTAQRSTVLPAPARCRSIVRSCPRRCRWGHGTRRSRSRGQRAKDLGAVAGAPALDVGAYQVLGGGWVHGYLVLGREGLKRAASGRLVGRLIAAQQ